MSRAPLGEAVIGVLSDEPRRVEMGRAARLLAQENYCVAGHRAAGSRRRTSRSVHDRARGPVGLLVLVLPVLALAIGMIWWRGPDWQVVHDAFTVVRWPWVAAAIGLNLLSVVARALCLGDDHHAVDPEAASAVPSGLLGVFRRAVRECGAARARRRARARCRAATAPAGPRQGPTATLIGSVFAHRMFDLFPAVDARHLGAARGEDSGTGP